MSGRKLKGKESEGCVTLSKTERQLLLYDIFRSCQAVAVAEITSRLPVGMRMIQRDMEDLTAAGLIRVRFSRKKNAWIRDEKPEFDEKASGRYREHLVRLNRLGRLMGELENDEISHDDPFVRSEYRSCSEYYRELFPECTERTRQRDFIVLNRIGYVIRYIPELCYYEKWEEGSLREDFGVFREKGSLKRRTQGFDLWYEGIDVEEILLLKEMALLKERGTAWMVRHDGKAIPVLQHIYAAKGEVDESLYAAQWLYQNTGEKAVKRNIQSFLLAWAFSCGATDSSLIQTMQEQIERRPYVFLTKEFLASISRRLLKQLQRPGAKEAIQAVSLEDYCAQVEADLNREFMRVRYGGLYNTENLWGRDIYFRISSDDYDWGAAILRFMEKAFFTVDTITVVRDEESTGEVNCFYCLADGSEIDHMDWESFLEGIKEGGIVKER